MDPGAWDLSWVAVAVAVFDRATNGTLTQKAGTAGCIVDSGSTPITDCTNTGKALDGPRSVTISPDGTSAYVASNSSDAVAVFDRAADGTLTQKAGAAVYHMVDKDKDRGRGSLRVKVSTGLVQNPSKLRPYVTARTQGDARMRQQIKCFRDGVRVWSKGGTGYPKYAFFSSTYSHLGKFDACEWKAVIKSYSYPGKLGARMTIA